MHRLICKYDLFQSGHDLDLQSNFQNDLLSSTYSSFGTSRQDEHDAGKMNVVPLRTKNLSLKKFKTYLEFSLSGG